MMTHFVLILGLFLLAVAVTMVIRALNTPAGPSTETIQQIGAYGFAGSLPTESEPGQSLRGHLDDITTAAGRWLGTSLLEASGEGLPLAADLGGHVHLEPRPPARQRSSSPRSAGHSWRSGSPASRAAARPLVLLATIGAAVLGWMLPMFFVELSRAEAPGSDRAGATRPDRPARRHARGRPQLPAVAPARGDEDQGASRIGGAPHAPGAEHGPHARRGARPPLVRIDTPGVRMFSRSIAQGETMGVSTGQIMRNLAVELRKRQQGLRGGARAEGTGEDPLPDHVPDHAGALHRPAPAGHDHDHGRARLAGRLGAPRPEPDAAPRGRPGRRRVGHRGRLDDAAAAGPARQGRPAVRARACSSAPPGRSTRRSCASRSTSCSSTPTRSWSRSCPACRPSRPPRAAARGRSWSFARASASDAGSRSATGSPGPPGLPTRRRPDRRRRPRGRAPRRRGAREQRPAVPQARAVPPRRQGDRRGGERRAG